MLTGQHVQLVCNVCAWVTGSLGTSCTVCEQLLSKAACGLIQCPCPRSSLHESTKLCYLQPIMSARSLPCSFQKDLLKVNLDTLAEKLRQGRLQPGSVITMQTLQEAGVIGKKIASGVKLLGGVCVMAASPFEITGVLLPAYAEQSNLH